MRRSDREVTDFTEIVSILRRAQTIRLGLHSEPYPYVVPLSFGFETYDKNITLYFHGAAEGLKHDLIANNPYACAEADILHRYAKTGASVTAEYESFIGFGKVNPVTADEAFKGLDLLLSHCGFGGFNYDRAASAAARVYKINLVSFSAKRRSL